MGLEEKRRTAAKDLLSKLREAKQHQSEIKDSEEDYDDSSDGKDVLADEDEELNDLDGFIVLDSPEQLFMQNLVQTVQCLPVHDTLNLNKKRTVDVKSPAPALQSAVRSKKSKQAAKLEAKHEEYFKSLMKDFDDGEKEDDDRMVAKLPHTNVTDGLQQLPSSVLEMEIDDDILLDVLSSDPHQLLNSTSNNNFPPSLIDQPTIEHQLASLDWNVTEEDLQALNFFEGQQQATALNPESIPLVTCIEPTSIARIDPESNDGDNLKSMWLIDIHERTDGVLILFGKIWHEGKYVSASLLVHGMLRNVFVLPRENMDDDGSTPVTIKAVTEEISKLANSHGVPMIGCKMVTRKYAFEVPDIPIEADYLKVVYDYQYPCLPSEAQGKSFSKLFGTRTTATELFLLKRCIKGPCWVQFKPDPNKSTQVKATNCRLEFYITDPKGISVFDPSKQSSASSLRPPPLTVASLILRTIFGKDSMHDTRGHHEIVLASLLIYQCYPVTSNTLVCTDIHTLVRDLGSTGFPQRFIDQLFRLNDSRPVIMLRSEKHLLSTLVTLIDRHDPDLVLGHNLANHEVSVLANRSRHFKLEQWNKFGRMAWKSWPKGCGTEQRSAFHDRQLFVGRPLLDTYLSAKEFVPKSRNYQLGTLCEAMLPPGMGRRESIDYDQLSTYFSTPDRLAWLVRHAIRDAHLQATLAIKLQVIPLTLQLTSLAGNLWSRTLLGGRAERNEHLLLHHFHGAKYICPDPPAYNPKQTHENPLIHEEIDEDDDEDSKKLSNKENKETTVNTSAGLTVHGKKAAYAGGLVLEPKRGFYDKLTMLLDFNSLYPSIIQEYNICFTTVERSADQDEMPEVPDNELEQGILPTILSNLVASRRSIKARIKQLNKDLLNESSASASLIIDQIAALNIQQQALKLTANSMYGCLGFTQSRFYAKPLAQLITLKGREALSSTVSLIQSTHPSLEVIYGDTDSVMIYTGLERLTQALALADQVKQAVNEHYKHLEIDLDGIFSRLLLLKKKKYAALIIEDPQLEALAQEEAMKDANNASAAHVFKRVRIESKGLDLVRRDWCTLAVDISTYVLEHLMAQQPKGKVEKQSTSSDAAEIIHKELTRVVHCLPQIPLEKFVISKNLTKEPEAYADARTQPHVMVALRMRARGQVVHAGDTIPYIICNVRKSTGSNFLSLAERAFHPDELSRDNLGIDYPWYLHQQVHPVVTRLVEFVPGCTPGSIATALGLDARRYQSNNAQSDYGQSGSSLRPLFTRLSLQERFRGLPVLKLSCSTCVIKDDAEKDTQVTFPVYAIARCVKGKLINALECHQCHQWISNLEDQIKTQVSQVYSQYIQSPWICSNCKENKTEVLTSQPHHFQQTFFTLSCLHCGRLHDITKFNGKPEFSRPANHLVSGLNPTIAHNYLYNTLLSWKHALSTEQCRADILNFNSKAPTTPTGEPTMVDSLLTICLQISAATEKARKVLDTLIGQCGWARIDLGAILTKKLPVKDEYEGRPCPDPLSEGIPRDKYKVDYITGKATPREYSNVSLLESVHARVLVQFTSRPNQMPEIVM